MHTHSGWRIKVCNSACWQSADGCNFFNRVMANYPACSILLPVPSSFPQYASIHELLGSHCSKKLDINSLLPMCSEEEITVIGKPDITKLGRSSQFSVRVALLLCDWFCSWWPIARSHVPIEKQTVVCVGVFSTFLSFHQFITSSQIMEFYLWSRESVLSLFFIDTCLQLKG